MITMAPTAPIKAPTSLGAVTSTPINLPHEKPVASNRAFLSASCVGQTHFDKRRQRIATRHVAPKATTTPNAKAELSSNNASILPRSIQGYVGRDALLAKLGDRSQSANPLDACHSLSTTAHELVEVQLLQSAIE